MPLTEIEEARLQRFINEMHFSEDQEARVREIAKLSKDDVPLNEIKKKVVGDWYFITENRMKLRRWQVW